MTFNPDGSKEAQEVILNRKKRKLTYSFLLLNNNNFSQVGSQKHLEVILNVKLTSEEHLKNVLNKTNKTIGLLRKLSNLLPKQTLITIYKAFVKLIQIIMMYSMTKLLIILSTQKCNPSNIMPV